MPPAEAGADGVPISRPAGSEPAAPPAGWQHGGGQAGRAGPVPPAELGPGAASGWGATAFGPVGGAVGRVQGAGHASVELAEPGCGQDGGQGRLAEPILGQGGAAVPAASAAAVVLDDGAGMGGDFRTLDGGDGVAGADWPLGGAVGRARSAAGNGAEPSPPERMATDTVLCGGRSACETATAATTVAMAASPVITVLGDQRRTGSRCTNLTSRVPSEGAGAPWHPDPSR